jgi:hypothetical protein
VATEVSSRKRSRRYATLRTMEFLMTDGTWRVFPEISSADVEQGILVCRNPSGDIVKTFARAEVAAFGDHLQLKDAHGNRRSGGRATDGHEGA